MTSINMKGTFLLIFSIISSVLGIELQANERPYCFRFTWHGPLSTPGDNPDCEETKGQPCIEPVLTADYLNTTQIWLDEKDMDEKTMMEIQTPDNVCITYTYTYNDAIVNTTKYCGKISEDRIIAVTSGCYSERKGVYLVEVCACTSQPGREPCNQSTKMDYSLITIIIGLLALLIKFNVT